jgi:hypothetical protein
MFIEREAYLQEYNRREMIQGLEAKRLVKSVQSTRPQSRGSFGQKVSRPFHVLHERVRVAVGNLKVA